MVVEYLHISPLARFSKFSLRIILGRIPASCHHPPSERNLFRGNLMLYTWKSILKSWIKWVSPGTNLLSCCNKGRCSTGQGHMWLLLSRLISSIVSEASIYLIARPRLDFNVEQQLARSQTGSSKSGIFSVLRLRDYSMQETIKLLQSAR